MMLFVIDNEQWENVLPCSLFHFTENPSREVTVGSIIPSDDRQETEASRGGRGLEKAGLHRELRLPCGARLVGSKNS